MCNLYTHRVMPEEMAGLIAHFKLIGRQFADVMRMKNDPDVDVYPNRRAPVIVLKDDEPVMRTICCGASRHTVAKGRTRRTIGP